MSYRYFIKQDVLDFIQGEIDLAKGRLKEVEDTPDFIEADELVYRKAFIEGLSFIKDQIENNMIENEME